MIFDPWTIVHYLSQFMVLEPGDLINTGTPPGVGMGFDPAGVAPGRVTSWNSASPGWATSDSTWSAPADACLRHHRLPGRGEVHDVPEPGRGPGTGDRRRRARRRLRYRLRVVLRADGLLRHRRGALSRSASDTSGAVGSAPSATGVDAGWVGRRVTGDTMLGCGHCTRCASGRQHLCADRYEIGVRNGWPGALAERLPVPATALVALPDDGRRGPRRARGTGRQCATQCAGRRAGPRRPGARARSRDHRPAGRADGPRRRRRRPPARPQRPLTGLRGLRWASTRCGPPTRWTAR